MRVRFWGTRGSTPVAMTSADTVTLIGRAVFLHTPDGYGTSELAKLLETRWPARRQLLFDQLRLEAGELEQWNKVAEGLVMGLDQATGMIQQFAGYFDLEDVDLRPFAGRAAPMDVVLGHERVQTTQIVKQADVVMLLGLLPEEFDRRIHEQNFAYYEPRCGHGSSLSRAVHAVVAARLGQMELAERYFLETAATRPRTRPIFLTIPPDFFLSSPMPDTSYQAEYITPEAALPGPRPPREGGSRPAG